MGEHIPSNIFLIGLMGAGKTTVGKVIAKNLGKTFYDTDQVIEQRTGVKIPTIFELEGESGFRKRETAMLEELSEQQNIVLATGGGAIIAPENRAILKQYGYVIYLRANVNELYLRTRNDKNRPLLQNVDVKAKLEQLFHARNPLYTETADLIVDTGHQPVTVIIHKIESALNALEPSCKP
ncbi:shikimate kinase [Methylophilus aquaticus]|uniref:Shikimate kinase n=1 Tax=Methylophilus aquaticus TaxID=1971610 RepID=A0ABT9JPL7_9PROT|nr:shikimate kinase [Methylophilus aquaticus]MDP8566424.1 shikimate kinase [Methylophilus aquaticus]